MYTFLSTPPSGTSMMCRPALAFAMCVAVSAGLVCAPALAAEDSPSHGFKSSGQREDTRELDRYTPYRGDTKLRFADDKSGIDHKTSRKRDRTPPIEFITAERLLSMLPNTLSDEQHRVAREMILEATPRLQEMGFAFVETCDELQTLSISRDTPPERLVNLGKELSRSRKAFRKELRHLSRSIEKATGVDLKLDDKKPHDKPLAKRLRHD